jgi:hypothetical protein
MSTWVQCKVANCLRRARKHGLCDAHYRRTKHRFGLRPELPIGGYIKAGPIRSVKEMKEAFHSAFGYAG